MVNFSKPFSSPSLPRRAETFSGFDKDLKPKVKEIDFNDGSEFEMMSTAEGSLEGHKGPQPRLMAMEADQQQAAIQMTHLLNNLTCMVAEHFTSLERYVQHHSVEI